MNKIFFLKTSLFITGIVTIAIWSLLIWEFYHEGVPSHHILARKDLPEISNWWGALLLPFLTWFLLYRIQKRLFNNNNEKSNAKYFPISIFYGFFGALFFGILLSAFFTFGNSDIPGYMLIGLFILGLFYPIYRAECILGFVLGMSYTFGAVLPTGVGSILALIGAVLYLWIRPSILWISSRLVPIVSSKHNKKER